MVFAGQLRRELAAAAAGRGPGRHGGAAWPGGFHVIDGDPVGPCGPGEMAAAAEPAGAGRLPAGHGAADEPPGIPQGAAVPGHGVAAAGGRAAAVDPGPVGALDRRRAPGHGAPSGGGLRPLPAAFRHSRPSAAGPPGVRGELSADRHPDGGRQRAYPRRLRGLGEPADGAVVGAAGGAGGGDRPAPGSAADGGGAGGRGGGEGRRRGTAGPGAGAGVRGQIAPAAGGFSGVAAGGDAS